MDEEAALEEAMLEAIGMDASDYEGDDDDLDADYWSCLREAEAGPQASPFFHVSDTYEVF